MSSNDNVKTVQGIYEAFGRGDVPAILDAVRRRRLGVGRRFDRVPWWGVRHGKAEVADFFTQLGTEMELEEFTPLAMIGDGDVVLTVVRFGMKSRSNGRRASMLLHHYWKFRDSKIEHYRGAEDTLQTLRTFQA